MADEEAGALGMPLPLPLLLLLLLLPMCCRGGISEWVRRSEVEKRPMRSALTGTTCGTTGLVPAGTHTGITIIIGMQLSTFATPPAVATAAAAPVPAVDAPLLPPPRVKATGIACGGGMKAVSIEGSCCCCCCCCCCCRCC